MRVRFLAVAASLLISSVAAIYPDDHWSFSPLKMMKETSTFVEFCHQGI
jgi:hypothetical protein